MARKTPAPTPVKKATPTKKAPNPVSVAAKSGAYRGKGGVSSVAKKK